MTFDRKSGKDEQHVSNVTKKNDMSVQEFLDKCPDDVALYPRQTVRIQWSRKATGFGEIYFYTDREGVLHCENETMSKAFVKEVLSDLVDKAVFDDPSKECPHVPSAWKKQTVCKCGRVMFDENKK